MSKAAPHKDTHKTITVSRIPDEGQTEKIVLTDLWVKEIFDTLYPNDPIDADSVEGKVRLLKMDDNVHLEGDLCFTHHPACARCGESFAKKENIILSAILTAREKIQDETVYEDAPEEKNSRKGKKKSAGTGLREQDAIGLDDLDFSVFEHDKFNLDEIIRDAIAMEQPYNYYCRNDCKGLCSRCGENLNKGVCQCPISLT